MMAMVRIPHEQIAEVEAELLGAANAESAT